jgi:hypothetical protein
MRGNYQFSGAKIREQQFTAFVSTRKCTVQEIMKTPINLHPIDASSLKPGMKFTAPLFFDDGVNMFLQQGVPLNRFHLDAVKNWQLKTVLSSGVETDEDFADTEELEEMEELEELEEVE